MIAWQSAIYNTIPPRIRLFCFLELHMAYESAGRSLGSGINRAVKGVMVLTFRGGGLVHNAGGKRLECTLATGLRFVGIHSVPDGGAKKSDRRF